MPETRNEEELRTRLQAGYETERARLFDLADADAPQGEYRHPVFGEGSVSARVLLIGEAPGAEETKLGRPFVGKAGKQLDALFSAFGIPRKQAYITNVVKYRPVVRSIKSVKNRTPLPREVEASLPLLGAEMALVKPAFVLTLGNTPLKAVLRLCGRPPETVGILHGETVPLTLGESAFTLIPLYHPASGIYNRSLVAVMEEDARKVGEAIHAYLQNGAARP